MLAFGLALRLRDDPTTTRTVLLGLAVGAALSTKAIEAHVLVPVAAVLLWPVVAGLRATPRRVDRDAARRVVLAGAVAVLVFVAVSVPFGWTDVWDQSVVYRADASAERDPLANAAKILSTLWSRDLTLYVFGAVAAVAGALAYRRVRRARPAGVDTDTSWAGAGGGRPSGRLLVVLWVAATLFWLVLVVSPLWRPHVSAIVAPVALLIGVYRPPWRATVVTAVVCVPLVFVQAWSFLAPEDYVDSEADMIARMAALPEGAWALSDEPGLVWQAGLRTTDDLVDASMLRAEQDRYTTASVAEAAADPRVCAVAVRSRDRFGSLDGLGDALAAEGYEVAATYGGPRVLYVRPDCDP
ncbi:MAG: hypothetical protein U5R31_10790 [Acidimicrobiia bacterium]|nr:hypothetical protein [Acidimicrobiia bacterium]